MTDDRFSHPAAEDDAPPASGPHQIRMAAAVTLLLTDRGWVVEEDPVAVLDADDEVVCAAEGHLYSPTDRAGCELEKERGMGMPMPSAQAVAEAFARAASRGWAPGRARSG